MELEVGMYYRYKGIIGKYYKPDLGKAYFTNQHKYTWNEIANGGKFSHNIIDLIEVGDYVNGELVVDKLQTPCRIGKQGKKFIFTKNMNIGEGYFEEDIKTIVTKEQFASMEYRLEV